jgi:hypothetical protein
MHTSEITLKYIHTSKITLKHIHTSEIALKHTFWPDSVCPTLSHTQTPAQTQAYALHTQTYKHTNNTYAHARTYIYPRTECIRNARMYLLTLGHSVFLRPCGIRGLTSPLCISPHASGLRSAVAVTVSRPHKRHERYVAVHWRLEHCICA